MTAEAVEKPGYLIGGAWTPPTVREDRSGLSPFTLFRVCSDPREALSVAKQRTFVVLILRLVESNGKRKLYTQLILSIFEILSREN